MSVTRKPTKNEKRRSKKKESATNGSVDFNKSARELIAAKSNGKSSSEVEYVSADLEKEDKALLDQFRTIFEKFSKPEELLSKAVVVAENGSSTAVVGTEGEGALEEVKKLSKKQKKLANRLSAAELKQLVQRPDAVEAHDVTSSDPRLLVYLKSYRNTVPVPRHWCAIRKYLQGKRGVEKVPFQLPEFIAETGIAKIRESVLEQEALKKGKQKTRERVRPKTGKIDIDYQVLHDAFFKYQTKPKMTGHGDLYYEGKEFEVNMRERRPGVLSGDLVAALGIQEGGPPPWLVNMQRYGLPPSYPTIKVPGLNAPLPPGASFGYQAGGWGKPPTDEFGRPLYGDVFGTSAVDEEQAQYAAVDKTTRWGALEPELEEEEEEEEEEEAGEDEEGKPARAQGGRADLHGAETPNTLDGISSITSGLETPDTIDLRKRAGQETPESVYGGGRELFTVIREQHVTGGAAGQMFGSDRAYVLPGKGDVTLSINPEELEEVLKDKERLRDAHEAAASSADHQQFAKTGSAVRGFGAETDDGSKAAGRKRKMEQSASVKKMREFKF